MLFGVPAGSTEGVSCDSIADCVSLDNIEPDCPDKNAQSSQGFDDLMARSREKAREAEVKNKQAEVELAKKRRQLEGIKPADRRAEEEEKRRQQDEVAKRNHCRQDVETCNNEQNGNHDLTPETISQCAALCHNMEIENCNFNSTTVEASSKLCTAGVARDQAAAAARRALAAAQQEAQAKWHCYGEGGSVRQGFIECQEACREFYNRRRLILSATPVATLVSQTDDPVFRSLRDSG
jgi:hypothetical protein